MLNYGRMGYRTQTGFVVKLRSDGNGIKYRATTNDPDAYTHIDALDWRDNPEDAYNDLSRVASERGWTVWTYREKSAYTGLFDYSKG